MNNLRRVGLLIICLVISSNAWSKKYPYINGSTLFEIQPDRVLSTNSSGVKSNNAYIYVQPDFSLNFNRNWSIKTQWRYQPNDILQTRNSQDPERYREFLQSDREVSIGDNGMLIEELKLHFENEDMMFQFGKYDPGFGTGYVKTNRIGIFSSQFNEDYNLREKLGASISALLEDSKITFNSFFSDTTDLSESAIQDRGRADRKTGIAGTTGTLSSYSLELEGKNLWSKENWNYNIGYRSLSVDNSPGKQREVGYVLGTSYDYELGLNTTLIPYFEIAKFSDFTGEVGRKATFITAALSLRYSSWNLGVSHLSKDITRSVVGTKVDADDKLFQLYVGYKFSDRLSLDFTRASVEEYGKKGSIAGLLMSYKYEF